MPPNFHCRNAFGQTFIHCRSPVRRFLKPKWFNFRFGQCIKAGQQLRCQFRPFVHKERQRFAGNGYSILEQIPAPFCKGFNAKTQEMEKGTPCPTVITYYQDKSFTFEIKTPPASHYLKKAAGLSKGSLKPGRDRAGSVTMAQCREIAEMKMKDLNAMDLDAATKIIAGSARSMGLEVVA